MKGTNMHGTTSKEMEVAAPANEVWPVFGLLKLEKFFTQNLAHLITKAEVLEGDGRVGTILKLTYAPGNYEFKSLIERYTKLDMKNRIFEAESFEGGYLDMGFSVFLYRAQVFEKSKNSCVIRFTVEYEVEEGVDLNVALPGLRFLENVGKVVAGVALKNRQT